MAALEAEFDSFVLAVPVKVGIGVIHLYTEVLAAWAAGIRDVGIDFFLLCIFFRLGVMPESIGEVVGDSIRLSSSRKAAKRLGAEFDVTVRLSQAGLYTLYPSAEIKWSS